MQHITRSAQSAIVNPMLPALDSKTRFGFGRRFLRSVSAILVLAVANLTAMPLTQAMQYRKNQAQMLQPGAGEQYADLLAQLKARTLPQQTAYSHRLQSASANVNVQSLEKAKTALEAEWTELRRKWHNAGVDAGILARQEQIERDFADKHQELITNLKNAGTAEGRQALARFVETDIPEPAHHPIDLDNMPWQVQKNLAREPIEDAEALNALIAPSSAERKLRAQDTARPTAADLNETLDAPHTDDIKALAARLDNNPHKIYQWVHDNIYFFPSYGSVQGAQDTLDKKSGNAFDTASLLIALLRSAQIPARYVYGTIDIPAEQVMNWVGDAKTPEAAQQILGQGGIPNIMLTSGGKVTAFRIEHVWAEAFVQYHPHRGAKHTGGQTPGDKWVVMDGSFKQYTYTQGMDL